MSLSFPPMKNSPSVSSTSNVSGSNTTSTVDAFSASVTVSTAAISVFNNLDGDRPVIPTTELEDRLNRMEDAIARLLMASTESRSLDLRQVMGYTVDSITLLGRAHKQISNERKECLKPVVNEDIRGLCNKDTTSSEYLFGENLVESMREVKENYRISNSIINTISSFGAKHRKISHNSRIGSKSSFDHGESSTRGSARYSLNFQGWKKNHQHQRASHSSHSGFTNKKSSKY